MLLNTHRYSAGDIVCFKLVNGDEVVARIKTDANDEFVVTKPCTVLPSPKGIGLVQSLFTAGQKQKFIYAKIMCSCTVKWSRKFPTTICKR